MVTTGTFASAVVMAVISVSIFFSLKTYAVEKITRVSGGTRSRSGSWGPAGDMAHARVVTFAAAAPFWVSLFLFLTMRFGVDPGPVEFVVGVVVLYYISLEVLVFPGYTGPYSELEGGKAEMPSERSLRLATVAFALGTLLVSQKDTELASRVGGLVFVGLLFSVLPSLATGPSAQRKVQTEPFFASVQRVCLTLGAGVIALALAVCVSTHKVLTATESTSLQPK